MSKAKRAGDFSYVVIYDGTAESVERLLRHYLESKTERGTNGPVYSGVVLPANLQICLKEEAVEKAIRAQYGRKTLDRYNLLRCFPYAVISVSGESLAGGQEGYPSTITHMKWLLHLTPFDSNPDPQAWKVLTQAHQALGHLTLAIEKVGKHHRVTLSAPALFVHEGARKGQHPNLYVIGGDQMEVASISALYGDSQYSTEAAKEVAQLQQSVWDDPILKRGSLIALPASASVVSREIEAPAFQFVTPEESEESSSASESAGDSTDEEDEDDTVFAGLARS